VKRRSLTRPASAPVWALLACVTWSTAARAQGVRQETGPPTAATKDTFALNWVRQTGAEDCVSSTDLAGLLEHLLGPVLRTAPEASLLVEGAVTRLPEASRWRAVIRVTDRQAQVVGERELTQAGEACAPLTRSILLVLAVLIDPDAAGRELPPEIAERLSAREQTGAAPAVAAFSGLPIPDRASEAAPPPASPPPPPAPAISVPADSGKPAPSRDPVAFGKRLTAGGATGSGHVPGFNVGGTIGAGFGVGRKFHLELDVWFWSARGVSVDGPYTNGGDVYFTATNVAATLCYPFVRSALEVSGCAGGMAGARFVNAEAALPRAQDPTRAYWGPTAGLEAAWLMDDTWFLRLTANAGFAVRKDTFEYLTRDGESKELFAPSSFLTWVGLSIGARL
jgi:hypothetical protein